MCVFVHSSFLRISTSLISRLWTLSLDRFGLYWVMFMLMCYRFSSRWLAGFFYLSTTSRYRNLLNNLFSSRDSSFTLPKLRWIKLTSVLIISAFDYLARVMFWQIKLSYALFIWLWPCCIASLVCRFLISSKYCHFLFSLNILFLSSFWVWDSTSFSNWDFSTAILDLITLL